MIAFVIGTTAEAIKVAPVIRRLQARGAATEIWATYQHTDSLDSTLAELGLNQPEYTFTRGANGAPLTRPTQMLSWLRACARALRRDRRMLRQRLGKHPLIMVHGDTMTTVFGAYAAKRLGVPAAHIEAGLRSGTLLRPFPEEIDRRIVGKLARVHFAPNESAAQLLRRKGKDVVNTLHNTAVDGVADTVAEAASAATERCGLVLLHRYEFISKPAFVRHTLETLAQHSPVPLTILLDAYSGGPVNEALNELRSDRITAAPKLSYPEFVQAMANAEFIVTDSGGIQEEAGLLGVPTLLHRKVTERPDGLGSNIVLSGWQAEKIRQFMRDYQTLRTPMARPEHSPSDLIVHALEERGYLPAARP